MPGVSKKSALAGKSLPVPTKKITEVDESLPVQVQNVRKVQNPILKTALVENFYDCTFTKT